MTGANLLYILFSLVFLVVSPWLTHVPSDTINIISLVVILMLGIPHGAIDDLLFLDKSSMPVLTFFIVYLGAIAFNVLLWIFLPVLAFMVFIIISAYHFGQSQLSWVTNLNKFWSSSIFLVWGLAVISAFVYLNQDELVSYAGYADSVVGKLIPLLNSFLVALIFYSSVSITILFLLILTIRKQIRYKGFIMEMILLVTVFLTAYLFPFLLGFALFFVILHSLKVMQLEFRHFYEMATMRNIILFIRKLLPLTLIAVAGITVLLGMIYLGWVHISYALAMLIIISSVTFPHVFVMERFYQHPQ